MGCGSSILLEVSKRPPFSKEVGVLPALRPQGCHQNWVVLLVEFESLALQND